MRVAIDCEKDVNAEHRCGQAHDAPGNRYRKMEPSKAFEPGLLHWSSADQDLKSYSAFF